MAPVACSSLHLRFFTWCLLRALTLDNILLQCSQSDVFFFVSVVVLSVVLSELRELVLLLRCFFFLAEWFSRSALHVCIYK
jgi:hypothetical protein